MPMMKDAADMIAMAAIATEGVDLFAGAMPAKPDNVVSTYESTGFEPVRTMGGMKMEQMNLQVIVRDLDPVTAEDKARTIFFLLDMFHGIINGLQYFSIQARHSPFSLGQDENQRTKFTCNYRVWKQPV